MNSKTILKYGFFQNYIHLFADEESVKKVVTNLQELRDQLPKAVQDCLNHFERVDRSLDGFEGLEAA